MVEFHPLIKKSYWSLVGLGVLYIAFLGTLTIPKVQTNFLYLHNVRIPFMLKQEIPEQFGFAKNQVTPFNLTTPDSETLFAWHVLPLELYEQNRDKLLKQPSGIVKVSDALSLDLLKNDPESRVIVYLHGNAGHVGQGNRPEAYRSLTSISATKVHLLTMDYRGFGRSTGSPDEPGLIQDANTLIDFVKNDLGIPPSRIVIVGQSLGTAVTLGAVESQTRDNKVDFAGVVLLSPFSTLKDLILTYSMGGVVPILGPLRAYPRLQRFFASFVREEWDGVARIKNILSHSNKLKLSIIHAENDFEINYEQSNILFNAAAKEMYRLSREGEYDETGSDWELTDGEVRNLKRVEQFGDEGFVETWTDGIKDNRWFVEMRRINWGGHDYIANAVPVGLVLRRLFGL